MKAQFMNESGGVGERRSMIHENRISRRSETAKSAEIPQKTESKKDTTS